MDQRLDRLVVKPDQEPAKDVDARHARADFPKRAMRETINHLGHFRLNRKLMARLEESAGRRPQLLSDGSTGSRFTTSSMPAGCRRVNLTERVGHHVADLRRWEGRGLDPRPPRLPARKGDPVGCLVTHSLADDPFWR